MIKETKRNISWDDAPVDITAEANFIWSIANKLRGSYMPDKYGDVIIPMVIIRRFECALEKTKDAVLQKFNENPNVPAIVLCRATGYQFYNTSEYDLTELCNDSEHIAANFKAYINGFSANVQDIMNELEMPKHIDKMEKDGCLYSVVKAFSELDIYPETYDSIKMGYIFENLIGRFYQNVEAGQFYTGRDIIKCLVEILLAEGCDDVFDPHKVITVCDQACGTGGMLSTTYNYIKHFNETADVRLFGQELMGQSYAVGLAEMLIKNQDSKNFRHADTFKVDHFANQKMRFVLENPPFGTPWAGDDAKEGQEDAVRMEAAKGESGRWGHGLPGGGDSQLIFMQSAIDKMDPYKGRAAIIENGSPLFNGDTSSGESQIRRWMLEEDLIEAIIALPTDLFYNTGIQTYVWILSRNKRPERKNKVQLINASEIFHKLRKPAGNKRNELTVDDRKEIVRLYANFEENECCKIFSFEDFLYREYSVKQPLQRSGYINQQSIEALAESDYFTRNSHIFNVELYEELSDKMPRSAKEEKQYNKMKAGKKFTEAAIAALTSIVSDELYSDYSGLKKAIKTALAGVEGVTDSRVEGIANELTEMDKTAVIQKNKNGIVLYDDKTKDTEIVPYTETIESYMAREVLPHIPDAQWFFEENTDAKKPVIKTGAEIPFTRYFYKYQKPQASEELAKQFVELEASVSERIKKLFGDM